jgi:hypothetical protein
MECAAMPATRAEGIIKLGKSFGNQDRAKKEAAVISRLVRPNVLALVCAASAVTTATARTPYDGAWSVLIVTARNL